MLESRRNKLNLPALIKSAGEMFYEYIFSYS